MKDFEDSMLEISQNNLNREHQRFNDLDNKAIGLITITGILITLLTNFVKLEACITKILFSFVGFFFFITIIFSILSLRVRLINGLSTNYLLEYFESETDLETKIKGLINTIGNAEDELDNVCSEKANEIKYAVYSFGIGITFLNFYIISIVILW